MSRAAVGVGASEDGRRVEVPGALPGERVRVVSEHEAVNGTVFGRLWSIGSRADARVPVGCRKFLVCGGCDLLHASSDLELSFKRGVVAEALGRPLDTVDPVIPSPAELHYRAVAKFVFGEDGALGSYAPRSHRVVDMEGCLVHAPVIERVAAVIRRGLRGRAPLGARYLVLRAALPHEVVHATLVMTAADAPAESGLLELLANQRAVAEVWRHVNAGDGDGIFDPAGPTLCLHRGASAVGRVGSADQHLATGAFAQVNPGAAERLYDRVVALAEAESRPVLDLYSGSGGISLSLAVAGAATVLGVERVPAAVDAAERAAAPFSGKVRFVQAPVEDTERVLEAEGRPAGPGRGFPIWVVNPPRKGLSLEVIGAIQRARPERVIYVSCEPERLARDLAALKDLYVVDRVSPVDMFPQTRHVETVARLSLLKEPA